MPENYDLERLHKLSFENEPAISSSEKCGCFYCGRIFDKVQILEWIDDQNACTALCPYCGIDSLLPDSKVHLTDDLLLQMRLRWFDNPSSNDT